ncbi:bifunctional diguanylate cyclase/phosphodiesterase [Vreelandella rituensis]|uniref:Bifunctional diguanylate cyclase/phosphodiesterase n=1 Tax=Vreelandella rituensis TaxID=2282306 RepID=A0A368TRM0_9GAMM|nr:bifunctional diguanylate cyclase/phosphodiesterase [Halomonas rituensis]RCV85883.1 bifunctional diguanylate cyclase/phosphodiesterase [Halomonas rituensis]
MDEAGAGVENGYHADLLATAVNGIIVSDKRGRILQANQAAEAMFRYAPGSLAGHPISILMPSPERCRHPDHVATYFEYGSRYMVGATREVEGIDRTGNKIPLLISVSTFKENNAPRFAAFLQDFSERKHEERVLKDVNTELEKRVRERTAQLEKEVESHQQTINNLELVNRVVQRATHAVVITDADNRILHANPAYEKMTGFKLKNVIGKKPTILKSGRHGPAFYRKMWAALNKDRHWEGEIWDRREDGAVFPKLMSIDRLVDETGKTRNFVAMFHDLSEQKASEEEIERLQYYDSLTTLPNRLLFRHRLQHEFEISRRQGTCVGVMLINIDRFKQVNDTFGFLAGDQLLVEVAERLAIAVRRTDLVARQESRCERHPDLVSRVGGDDFAVILNDLKQPENATAVATRILDAMNQPFTIQNKTENIEDVFLQASIGIGIFPDNAANIDALVRVAETALGQAKSQGGGEFRFFSDSMNKNSAARARLESDLRRAVAGDAFTLYYQPKLDLKTNRFSSMEALIRWPRGDGMVSPADFIPLAEETNLIVPLGAWVLRRACRDTMALSERIGWVPGIAINLSARQFRQPGLIDVVRIALEESGIPPEKVELEITEGMVMDDVEAAIDTMQALRDLGVQLAIDDFGTGYSSLSYLKRFPVNTLKLDRAFIRDLPHGVEDTAITEAVIALAKALKLHVVAEGVETRDQLTFLGTRHCGYVQGFLLARPGPLENMPAIFLNDFV